MQSYSAFQSKKDYNFELNYEKIVAEVENWKKNSKISK